jgi:hypothetical protein
MIMILIIIIKIIKIMIIIIIIKIMMIQFWLRVVGTNKQKSPCPPLFILAEKQFYSRESSSS